MKNAPNSKVNLDRAIQRFAGGTGLKFRYGERMSRVTLDLDTAWKTDLDAFLKGLNSGI